MKKAASALALAGALTFVGTSVATANEYPAPPPGLTVEDATVAPGSTVVIQGAGFDPFEDVDVTVTYNNDPQAVAGMGVNGLIILNQPVASFVATAFADGTFKASVPVGTEEGTYTITATGQRSGNSFSTVVAVSASFGDGDAVAPATPADPAAGGTQAASGSGLADTGADSTMLLWGAAGVLALGAGAASIAVSRRKRA